ncbi:carbohydrate ABC transporter permease [Brachyspira hampsonii]|uniref:Maltose/maltodextrin transport system permease protein MalG n=1 Tax=Brachyspira hampsonii 30446 TaxID=1289135 RepID=A0A2U4F1C1_9SPIR|nr:carbohydrate ABC transporter permease [Brachyspira hampsonii]EKV56057.1 ABC transporter permease [Brachyspira hampsonii 30446]MBW5389631.1 carbohydrate ABC transporter permease [Brachyspira hampsonii]MBW5394594.1 carbohydrate ABC transporter permease [Brachyspira hampsonii]OEJ20035.1 sugar ABC transporter permease [Brachyspira hampsonii]
MKDKHKQIRLLPGYLLVSLWCAFTFLVIGWIILASFSTTPNIFQNTLFKDGLHPENYVKALVTHNVAKYFLNSLIYTIISCVGIIVVSAPAAYILARFPFRFNSTIQKIFVTALGIPAIMIIMPLFGIVTSLKMTNSRLVLIFLYIGINIPFTVFFLITFFKSLSFTFEEAAAIDGCSPMKTFWIIMLPLAQPGIITVTIFNFITVWNEYFMALIFANSSNMRPLAVGLFSMIQSMRYTGDWAGMFAAVVIVFLPTFILYIILSEKIIANVTGGAIKG